MRFIATILFALILVGCATTAPSPKTTTTTTTTTNSSSPARDGATFEKAIVIKGVKDTEAGINAENTWIHEHFGPVRKTMQALVQRKGKAYDIITIELPNRQTQDIYFDITSFFGK